MAHVKPASLFIARVHKWEDRSKKRVLSEEATGDSYLLNVNSIDGLIAKPNLTNGKSSMYYFDNPFDHRDNSHYMVTDHTAAQIIAHIDTAMTHQHMSLNVYPTDDPTESTVAHIFKVADVAYARAVPDYYSATQSYIFIRENQGFKLKRYRVNHTIIQILALVA
jgi:hypothetical protein